MRGRTLDLVDPFVVVQYRGFGPLPVEHVTERGVFQDGETFRDARADARAIALAIDVCGDSVAETWENVGRLYRFLGPVLQGCYLVSTLPDGQVREIVGRYVGVVEAAHDADESPFVQRVVVPFRCADPAFYASTATLWVYDVAQGAASWGYPLGFPSGFGISEIDLVEARVYEGTLPAYPVITIEGPASGVVIANEATAEALDLAAKGYVIGVDEVVTIDTRPAHKSVMSSVNGNIIDKLSDDSSLGSFHIAPDPEVAEGRNTMRIVLADGTNATRVQFQFYSQFGAVV